MLGELLFRPTERDLVALGGAPTRLSFLTSGSGASSSINCSSGTVPTDEFWVIAGATCVITPGAAQFALFCIIDVIEPISGAQIYRPCYAAAPELGATVAQQTGFARALTNAIVMPGEAVRATGNFNAGAAANTVQMSFYGLKIPRGNLLK